MTERADGLVLASGGLDSTTLAYWLLEQGVDVLPLFVDYGQHCARTEWETLREVLPLELRRTVERVHIGEIYRDSESRLISQADLWKEPVGSQEMYLPYRNLLLLTVGAAFAQSRGLATVYSAFINSNHALELDCSTEFFNQLANMLSEYGAVSLTMPFREWTKVDVATLGIELGVPVGRTYSCQISASVPCGACPNCVERLAALDLVTGT